MSAPALQPLQPARMHFAYLGGNGMHSWSLGFITTANVVAHGSRSDASSRTNINAIAGRGICIASSKT